MLQIVASATPDSFAQDLLNLCTADVSTNTELDTDESGPGDEAGPAGLRKALWGDRALDQCRLKVVLARWCAVSIFSNHEYSPDRYRII